MTKFTLAKCRKLVKAGAILIDKEADRFKKINNRWYWSSRLYNTTTDWDPWKGGFDEADASTIVSVDCSETFNRSVRKALYEDDL